jgi:nucleoside-diphosphate-sugar epimerase
MRVGIFGASGFVGATLAELLLNRTDVEMRLFINRAGSAWRLTRRNLPLTSVDITDEAKLADAMRGLTHVVNCTRGRDEVMFTGLRNLLAESRRQGVQRFVHLSSVAVYGDPPPPASEHEAAPARPAPSGYGMQKLKQDEMVARAHRDGLSCAILCPPNIGGCYSTFPCSLVEDLRHGRFPLLGDGSGPINIVDVENLCHAIELALGAPSTDGQRIFVTDGDITWAQLVGALAPLAQPAEPVPSLPADDPFWARLAKPMDAPRVSPLRTLKHLVSSDVRKALAKDPLLGRLNRQMRGLVGRLPPALEDRMRLGIEGPIRVPKRLGTDPFTSRYAGQQLRRVRHRTDRAAAVLGYSPRFSFDEAMIRFAAWYRAAYAVDTPSWPLAREIEAMLHGRA